MYRATLIKILKSLEPEKDAIVFADLIAMLSKLAAGFHDLGKADKRWQKRVAEIEGGTTFGAYWTDFQNR